MDQNSWGMFSAPFWICATNKAKGGVPKEVAGDYTSIKKKPKFFNSCTLSWDLTFFQIEKKNLKTVVIVELCSVKLTHHWTKHIQNRSKEKKKHVHLHCSQRGIYSNLKNRATGLYSASSPFRKIAPHALLNKQAMPQLWKHVLP